MRSIIQTINKRNANRLGQEIKTKGTVNWWKSKIVCDTP